MEITPRFPEGTTVLFTLHPDNPSPLKGKVVNYILGYYSRFARIESGKIEHVVNETQIIGPYNGTHTSSSADRPEQIKPFVYKSGDKVVVKADTTGHKFPIGTVAEVSAFGRDNTLLLKGPGFFGMLKADDVELACTSKLLHPETTPSYKVGDRVRITTNSRSHLFTPGDIGVITAIHKSGTYSVTVGTVDQLLRSDSIEPMEESLSYTADLSLHLANFYQWLCPHHSKGHIEQTVNEFLNSQT